MVLACDVARSGLAGDAAVARLASLQYGVVSRAQLLILGLSEGAIDHRVTVGRLHCVHRGVYRVGHEAPLLFAREAAALLACGELAVLSHFAAGAIWVLAPADELAVDVTVVEGDRRPRPGIRLHRSSLSWAEVTTCRGLPVTTPVRTLADLSRSTTTAVLERAVEDARRRRLVTRKSLLAAAARAPRLRALLDAGPAFTRSQAEQRMVEVIRKAGLPAPDYNVRVAGYEVDVLWREDGLVVEIDGYAYHSGRAAFERDRARDAHLMTAGLRVLRITWRQLADEPERVVALVASGLRPLRGPGAGRGLAAPPR
jgi:very-short-patch-repair endonuclease